MSKNIGIARKSGRGEDPLYQIELLEKYGAEEIITVKESAYDEYRPEYDKKTKDLYNKNIGFTEISRITRRGYDALVDECENLWSRNNRIFVIRGKTFSRIEITANNIHKLYHEAILAIDRNYLRDFQTKEGINTMNTLHKLNQTKSNTGLPLDKKIINMIFKFKRQGFNNSHIAKRLNISRPTVIKYLKVFHEENNV